MKTLKVSYKSMWPGYDPNKMPQDYFFEYALSHKFNVVYDDANPDVVIYSVFGEPPRYSDYSNNPVFIGYTGEPYEVQTPADLYFGFVPQETDNYFRLPLWALYMMWNNNDTVQYKLAGQENIGQGSHHVYGTQEQEIDDPAKNPLLVTNIFSRHLNNKDKTKFCNFTYNNPVQSRIEFFMRLREYKMVESTGGLMNNTNYRMVSKTKELGQYKFTIAFENSIHAGYVTEKLMEPLAAGSVPIYLGGLEAPKDFNPKSFINGNSFSSLAELVEYVKEVDSNDELYNSYLNEPVFNNLPDYPSLVCEKIYSKLVQKNEDFIS